MEDTVICPNCGETNPADLPYCQYCQWRLRALDGEWESPTGADSDGAPDSGPGPEDARLPDWLRDGSAPPAASESGGSRDKTAPAGGSASPNEDLFAGLSESGDEDNAIPDWVARIMNLPAAQESPKPASPEDTSLQRPDLGSGPRATPGHTIVSDEQGLAAPGLGRSPIASHWPTEPVNERAGREHDEISEWLRQLDAAAVESEEPRSGHLASSAGDVPDWVEAMMGIPDAPAPVEFDNLVPGWLEEQRGGALGSDGGPSGPIPSTPTAPQTSWPPPDLGVPESSGAGPRPPFSVDEPQEATAASSPEEIQRLDVDAVFASMQMPEWLADLASAKSVSLEDAPAAAPEEEPITPADLPSWIQAMRPLETGVEPPAGRDRESPVEEGGPLLGLQGVLPAIPGAALPSGRPRAQSLTLDVSERNRAHAKLLNDVLAAETQPRPLTGMGLLGSQRSLRWVIGLLLAAVVGGALFSGSRIFPLPTAVPNESHAAIKAVEGLPTDATVLAVFDYEPATVGEMEATAAALMDHLLLLKHPRLAVVSTSPTGSVLADRFMSVVLADRSYARGTQYVNLGYLPGGLAGVQAFARDPSAAVPLGASSDRVWESSILLGTRRLSDFAAIIVITDSLESGRVWIEQTSGRRGSSLMILVSSAQAGPTLLPYYDAGQVDGLVAGLNGAAGPEIANNGFPGLVRRYWDAYSLGLYSAVVLISLGVLWQYWILFRTHRREET